VRITVKFFPYLGKLIQTNELELDLSEGAGLKDLMRELTERFGRGFIEALYVGDLGPVDPYTSVIVDGRAVLLSEGTECELRENSVVAFIPPLGGG
jgi:molybdopterin converting factor small subunit